MSRRRRSLERVGTRRRRSQSTSGRALNRTLRLYAIARLGFLAHGFLGLVFRTRVENTLQLSKAEFDNAVSHV